jgi:hypothetical protein
MSVILIHYFVAVVQPKREKQSVKAMYSIEYSPQYGGDSRLVYSMYYMNSMIQARTIA